MAKILAFAGSARADSHNKKLIDAAAGLARNQGAEVTVIDLRDYRLPLYDGDLEELEGQPDNATRLYELFKQHDGLLLSSPEYNGSISPLLKNVIDWVSRPREGEPPLRAFQGKVASLLSASPGSLGGIRGLVHVRDILGNIGVIVLPKQYCLSNSHSAFASDGFLADEKTAKQVAAVTGELTGVVAKLN